MEPGFRARAAQLRRDLKRWRRNRRNARSAQFRDFDAWDRDTIRRVSPYTMTSWQKLHGLLRATEYVVAAGVPGAIVECGVWRGGSMMAVALALLRRGVRDRELHLFDTFAGMPEPGPEDVFHDGTPARREWLRLRRGDGGSDWCRAELDDVRAALLSTGYPQERLHFAVGRVEDTLPARAPDAIALLRLDTDFHASVRHALEHLFPRLAAGGVLLIDDYGSWSGARAAVDDYLREQRVPLLLSRLDAGARIGVKPAPRA